MLDSDDDEEENEPVNDHDQIAQDIFDQDSNDDDAQSTRSARSQSRQSERYTAIEDVGEDSDEGENIDDFIVDDDDQPINTKKAKKKSSSTGQYIDRYVGCNYTMLSFFSRSANQKNKIRKLPKSEITLLIQKYYFKHDCYTL